MTQARKTAVVIGSGFGGLAVAIRLQASGFHTVIFEKRDLPGGRAYVYYDHGFTFDAGPTVLTAPHCLRELFTLVGRRLEDYLELLPVTPFYRLSWEDGVQFDYSNDAAMLCEHIRRLCPRDVQGYDDFLRYSAQVFHQGYTRLAHVPFLRWWHMVRALPQLVRLRAYRSVYTVVAQYIRETHLRQALSFHALLVGGNPFTTSSIYILIHFLERNWGVFFPRGGMGAVVRALVLLFQELGGEIEYQAETAAIVTRHGRVQGVRLRDGRYVQADLVISNADVMHTYSALLRDEPQGAVMRRRLTRMRYGMSLFVIYFGTSKKYPGLAHHNVLFGPRYQALLRDIFDIGRLARDFSLYLHVPSVSDPTLAPPGCEAFYVLSPVPHLGKCPIDWHNEGQRYAERILTYLDQRYLPGLRTHLVTRRLFTPADFKSELHAHLGAAFSLEPLLTQSAFFRVHNRDDRIGGLYIVGAGTHPGAGIPGVINSAKATASVILHDYGDRR